MNKIIKALKSRTVWLAIAQAAVGIVIIVLTEADMVSYALFVKSIADIILRVDTKVPISKK